jgi:glycosyltransferase involved in cell wall biosynthesis
MHLDSQPLVSILIPFYNHNHFIKFTLDSILEDTYPNKEIIIINDGSSNPDDSNIEAWINKHGHTIDINYIKRENKGVTKTLNELISLSKGKYIVVSASDDYLINNSITKRVQLLEENPHKLLLLSDNIVVNDNGEKIYESNLFEYRKSKKKNYIHDNKLKQTVINRWSAAGACFMVNKKIYEDIGDYDETLIVEDWDFFLRAVSKNLILFYDEKVSAYRLHDSNTINNPKVALTMQKNQAFVAKKNLHLFSFPHNIYLFRRYIKYMIKVRKMEEKFPYSLSLYKSYKAKKYSK